MVVRYKRLGFRVLAVVGSAVLTLFLAEAAARLFLRSGPAANRTPFMMLTPAGYRLIPGNRRSRYFRMNGRTVNLGVNSLGFRGPEISSREGNHKRVLFLGDSIVFGTGVEPDQTIPAMLQQYLSPHAEVINAGVPGLSLSDEAALLAEWADVLQPDVVLVGFYLNDFQTSPFRGDRLAWMGPSAISAINFGRSRSLLFSSAVGIYLRSPDGWEENENWINLLRERRWVDDRQAFLELIGGAGADFEAAWREDEWAAAEDQLVRMWSVCDAIGARMAIVLFPVAIQVESSVADDFPQQKMKALASRRGFSEIDILSGLPKGAKGRRLFYDHCHYTPEGAAYVAAQIAAWVYQEELLFLPPPIKSSPPPDGGG
jgi:hypothetical protein